MGESCRLCSQQRPIQQSHIVPKFVGKWVKETGITPYLRFGGDIERRFQDMFSMPLLCRQCETLLSGWESAFASRVFHPNAKGEYMIHYGEWLIKFASSLSWRALHYRKELKPDPDEDMVWVHKLEVMERHLRSFLLGKEKHVGEYTHHIYPVGIVSAPPNQPSSPMLNRYLSRATELDYLRNDDLSEVYLYIKLPMFMFIAIVESPYRKWMETARIKKRGLLHDKQQVLPIGFLHYIVGQADKMNGLYRQLSPSSLDAMDRAADKSYKR